MKSQKGSRFITPLLFNLDARRWWLSTPGSGRFTPAKDPVLIAQEAGLGPMAYLNECGKSRPTVGFDTRTVQAVASRYAD
jgi:hypothetical protein